MRTVLLVLALLAAGCSWLVGVSDDPVVVDAPANDAGDEDAAPE